ncbi:hypothetical protein QUB07_27610 [Microcoleus sp. F8-C5]
MKRRYFIDALAALLGKGFSDFFCGVEGVLTDILGGPRKWPLDILPCIWFMMECSPLAGETN